MRPGPGATIMHRREVLGNQPYESFARTGEAMTTAAIVAYAYDQIEQARGEMDQDSR
ncbi:hypothetical protein ACGFK1_19945 [Mycobacterium sp. NPDC048908]|uniref:hypothetical protein n=1 Tax=Mycobacterium sp. NPDC048908 TaxID=3364292 RepID=UPI0037142BBE